MKEVHDRLLMFISQGSRSIMNICTPEEQERFKDSVAESLESMVPTAKAVLEAKGWEPHKAVAIAALSCCLACADVIQVVAIDK